MSDSKVLLIEANDEDAKLLEEWYAAWGFHVMRATEGQGGMQMARQDAPSLILLAVELPGLSGYTTCGHIKRETVLQSIPLFITSSQATPETFEQHKTLRTRAEEYLHKPLERPLLKELTERHLGLNLAEAAAPEAAAPEATAPEAAEEEMLFDEPEPVAPAVDEGLMEVLDDLHFFSDVSDVVDVDSAPEVSIGEINFDEPDDLVELAPPSELPPSPPAVPEQPVEAPAEAEASQASTPVEEAVPTASAVTAPPARPSTPPAIPPARQSRPSLSPATANRDAAAGLKAPPPPRFSFPARPTTGVIPRVTPETQVPSGDAEAVNELQAQLTTLQAQHSEQQSQLGSKDEEISSLKTTLSNAERQVASLRSEIDTLKDIEATQQGTIERQTDEIAEMRGQLLRLGEQLAVASDGASREQMQALESQLESAQREVARLSEENALLQSTVQALEQDIQRVQMLIGPVRLRDFLLAMQDQLTQTIAELDHEIASADQLPVQQ
ncbi:MAG: response regulator [Myxococcota bacterium]|jgi:CheY-like chemotaxis protein/predicted  nucleic acid-binding Zn-ribbon protein|nr:response regulator [Myxococcota bacterium]